MSAALAIAPVTRLSPSAYRNARADLIRAELLRTLGGECAICHDSSGHLEIDHPWGRDWKPHKMPRYRRWLRYRREAALGLVRLLCRSCNASYRPRRLESDEAKCPF